VDLSVQGSVLLCRQRDQPGIVGSVGMALAKGNINISFMTVCRTTRNEEAIMAIGIDDEPTKEVRSTQQGHRDWVHHYVMQYVPHTQC
jgi:D-3-phosphoglycerate dehydrogenase